jgi:hypothetical protein
MKISGKIWAKAWGLTLLEYLPILAAGYALGLLTKEVVC